MCWKRDTHSQSGMQVMVALKERWQKLRVYGWYALGTLIAVDAITFGALYGTLSTGVDVVGGLRTFLQWLPMDTESGECE